MLEVYICPSCGLVRYVSKDKTHCFRCDVEMHHADISYADYIKLNLKERMPYIEKAKTAIISK